MEKTMNSKDYIKEALRTEVYDTEAISKRLSNIDTIRLIHASEGMQTESAEFTDTIKKFLFYGKPLDIVNLKEELGDLLWYIAIACDTMGVSIEELMSVNIQKLKARYPEGFTEEKAINRDISEERKILEF
jgi:NTP pyrophosphatase (non-canonical NTP hydrolase)